MNESYEFWITGRTTDKDKILEICNLFDDLEISYNCSFREENQQETDKKLTRNPQEEAILEFCKEEKTLKEIMEFCGYKDVGNFREQYINPLILDRKLQMTIPDQPNNRNQKYVNISQKFFIKEREN